MEFLIVDRKPFCLMIFTSALAEMDEVWKSAGAAVAVLPHLGQLCIVHRPLARNVARWPLSTSVNDHNREATLRLLSQFTKENSTPFDFISTKQIFNMALGGWERFIRAAQLVHRAIQLCSCAPSLGVQGLANQEAPGQHYILRAQFALPALQIHTCLQGVQLSWVVAVA